MSNNTYKVILHNEQGAVLEDEICGTVEDVKDLYNSYSDPENITITVYEGNSEDGREEVSREWYFENEILEEEDTNV